MVPNDFCQETLLESESLISASSVCVCANDFDVQAVFVCTCTPACTAVNVCLLSTAFNMTVRRVWLVEWMPKLKSGGLEVVVVMLLGGCRASVPLRQSASATKRIANTACLAFSEGNRPIDFWLGSVLFTQKGSGALVKEKLTHRWRRGRAGRRGKAVREGRRVRGV